MSRSLVCGGGVGGGWERADGGGRLCNYVSFFLSSSE